MIAKSAAGAAASEQSHAQQYLTFLLGTDQCAINILGIKEIIEYGDLTAVPMAPGYVRGVINLRGSVVPVVDLSVRFGRTASAVGRKTCIVIVEVAREEESEDVGVVVDAVNAVVDIAPADIEAPPSFGSRIRNEFILGLGKVDGRFVILLDSARVLALDLGTAATDAGAGTTAGADSAAA